MLRFGLLLALAAGCLGWEVKYDGDKVIRIPVATQYELFTLESHLSNFEVDMWLDPVVGGHADVHIKKDDVETFLKELPLSYEIFVDDLQLAMDKQVASKSDEWFEAYHPLGDLDQWLFDIVSEFQNVPGLTVELHTIGVSTYNRTIYGIEFHGNSPNRIDIFWNGGHHAREWIGPATVHYLIYNLLHGYGSDVEITSLMNSVNFHIVPVLNPDGYTYTWTTDRNWRKTRSTYNGGSTYGVDPNRNWDYQWGGTGSSGIPSSGTYRGPSPFSEPECLAAANYIRALPNCHGYIDWHSYGQYILSPWGYTATLPVGVEDHLRVGRDMEAAIRAVNNNAYRYGPSGDTLYPTSGSAPDYTFGYGIKYSYTIELPGNPGGFQLPPQYILPVGRESLAGALVWTREIVDEFTQ